MINKIKISKKNLSIFNLFREKSVVASRRKAQKGVVSPSLYAPDYIVAPDYAINGVPLTSPTYVQLFGPEEIPKLRTAARLARKMLEYANSLVVPGITTDEIDKLVHLEIIKHGAYPTPLNYYNFPKSICTSVNDVVCHGIPDDKPLLEGDIVSIDGSLYIDGFHGDNCGSVPVGKVDDSLLRLISCTKEAVDRAIAICKPDACISEIGGTIERYANENNYNVVPSFCGHGLGKNIHLPPTILHFKNDQKFKMKPGMVFTIEPSLAEGSGDTYVWSDGWTAATKDGSWAAQIEHEVLITEDGAEVLTILEE